MQGRRVGAGRWWRIAWNLKQSVRTQRFIAFNRRFVPIADRIFASEQICAADAPQAAHVALNLCDRTDPIPMNTSDQTRQLGIALRARRKQLGLTQLDLTELSGVSLSFIHDLENGKPTVQLAKVLAVADTLGCELSMTTRRPDRSRGPQEQ